MEGKEYKDGKLIFEVEYFLKKMGTNSLWRWNIWKII